MIAVPKGTKTLIFSTQRDNWLSADDLKRMEASLTKRIGIPCVVLTGWDTLLIPQPKEAWNKVPEKEPVKFGSSGSWLRTYGLTAVAMVLSLIALIAQAVK